MEKLLIVIAAGAAGVVAVLIVAAFVVGVVMAALIRELEPLSRRLEKTLTRLDGALRGRQCLPFAGRDATAAVADAEAGRE